MKKTHKCKILKNEKISENVFRIVVSRPLELADIKSGQFFNIKPGEDDYPILRRPISVSMISEDTIEFIIIENGFGTKMLKEKRHEGSYLDVLGPLGNGYELDENHKKVLVVGGGIGIAPQRLLTKELKSLNPEKLAVIMGFRDTSYCLETYREFADEVIISTESGKEGYKGYISKPLEEELKNTNYDMVYACGPKQMLVSVKQICEKYETRVQLLMEERMACGIGACLVCTCKIKDEEKGYKNKRTCKDGPVFYGEEVMFDE